MIILGVANDFGEIFFGGKFILRPIVGVKVDALHDSAFKIFQVADEFRESRVCLVKPETFRQRVQSRNAVIDAEIVVEKRADGGGGYQRLVEVIVVLRRQN